MLAKLGKGVLPKEYIERLCKIKYLHATNLIIESRQKVLDDIYWLNIVSDKVPIVVIVQHTNIADKKYYGNKHILYIGNYVDSDSLFLKMDKNKALDYFLPYLQQINNKNLDISDFWYFKEPYAQPIFDRLFVKNKPDFTTPTKNFFIANLDMTYPYDRGTNFAVKLGKEVAKIVLQ